MMNDTVLHVEVQMHKSKWDPELPFDEAFRKLFWDVVDNTCWATGPDPIFRVLAGVALVRCEDEDREWVERQVKDMRRLCATLQALKDGVPVDMSKMEPPHENERPYTLAELFHEEMNKYKEKTGRSL